VESKQKVFGLGLSKTATSSLANALQMLGYRTVHNPTDDRTIQALMHGRVRCQATDDNDAICDIAFVRHFRELDREFPGSKFVLTIRSRDAWLRSCRRHWASRYALLHDLANEDLVDFNVYGTTRFNYRLFMQTFESHSRDVREFFSGRAKDLLILDICAGGGWKELCEFLGKEVPVSLFPHVRPRPWVRERRASAA
jgi:hypothetical protein